MDNKKCKLREDIRYSFFVYYRNDNLSEVGIILDGEPVWFPLEVFDKLFVIEED